jgi:hypothetical protein
MFVNMPDEALMQQKRMRPSGNVGVDGHGEYEFVVLAVKVIKMVLFNISWGHPAIECGRLTLQMSSISLAFTKP